MPEARQGPFPALPGRARRFPMPSFSPDRDVLDWGGARESIPAPRLLCRRHGYRPDRQRRRDADARKRGTRHCHKFGLTVIADKTTAAEGASGSVPALSPTGGVRCLSHVRGSTRCRTRHMASLDRSLRQRAAATSVMASMRWEADRYRPSRLKPSRGSYASHSAPTAAWHSRRRLNPTLGLLVRCRGVSGIASGSAQILVDESGRRRLVLRWSGRAVSVALLVWLGLLALGALGLQPLGQFPVLGQAQPRSSPPALPGRIEAAGARGVSHRGAAAPGAPRARPGRLDAWRGRERVPGPRRERPSGAAGASKVSPPSRPETSGAPSRRPATTAPSGAGTGTTSALPSASTGVAAGGTGPAHGKSTSSPGLTDSSPGLVKPDGAPAVPPAPTDPSAPASPPVPTDAGQSAEHPPHGRGQSLTVPTP
jgi:hypothetical protein